MLGWPKFKKGSEFDIIFTMGITIVIMVSVLFAVKIYDGFRSGAGSVLSSSPVGESVFRSTEDKMIPMFDTLVSGLFMSLIFISLISALFIRTHPVFFIISLFLIAIALILSVIFGNLSEIFLNGTLTQYNTVSESFTFTRFIMENLTMIILVMSIMLTFLLYSFGRNAVFGS